MTRLARTPRYRSCAPAILFVLAVQLISVGCTRRHYRLAADREVQGMIHQKSSPYWPVTPRPVEVDPRSRMADPTSPDCPPLPPDDPAAADLMAHPYKFRGSKVWRDRSHVPFIEYPAWQEFLPRDADGNFALRRQDAMQLALLHSREYQTEFEGLYFSALNLSLDRFEFDINWSASTAAVFDALGNHGFSNEQRTLRNNNQAGFTRNLVGGGLILVTFANEFVWEFAGGTVSSASSGLLFELTQPLLRGAFREVRLESLTQSERDLLYTIRQFYRFRRQFYVDVMGGSGYLGLLSLAQAIRNQERNVISLERNLLEHRALADAGLVAPIQVDQVYQDYQRGRLTLMAANQALQSSLDRYKLRLGLPPRLEVRLDETALEPFELNDARFDELEAVNEEVRLQLLQFDVGAPPDRDISAHACERLIELYDQLPDLLKDIQSDLERWHQQLKDDQELAETDPDEMVRRRDLARELSGYLAETGASIVEDRKRLEKQQATLDQTTRDEAWTNLKELSGNNFRERLVDMFVIQNQTRVYLIQIVPLQITPENALSTAVENRLDLMNVRGRVIDALRRVEIAADGLEADLDLTLQAELGTDRGESNAFRFDASASRYRAGVRFDSPVNRLAERNRYRAAQIEYQQARRQFMAARDTVEQEVREDLRRLEFSQFQFEVARRQLITAVRQVEEAQLALRGSTAEPNSSLTRDLLTALDQLLSAKNSLIGSWVAYETSRLNLFRDLGTMQIDGEGTWADEYDSINSPKNADGLETIGAGPIDTDTLLKRLPPPALEPLP